MPLGSLGSQHLVAGQVPGNTWKFLTACACWCTISGNQGALWVLKAGPWCTVLPLSTTMGAEHAGLHPSFVPTAPSHRGHRARRGIFPERCKDHVESTCGEPLSLSSTAAGFVHFPDQFAIRSIDGLNARTGSSGIDHAAVDDRNALLHWVSPFPSKTEFQLPIFS